MADLRSSSVSDSRLPQPGGPGSRIYIPQKQGDAVIHPGTRFPFRRLLRLAGLRWRYSTPRPHGCWDSLPLPCRADCFRNNFSARTPRKTPSPIKDTCLQLRCLAMGMTQTHIENTSFTTCSIVACVYCGRCLTLSILYCWLRICCSPV
jgi:hypothetical protein